MKRLLLHLLLIVSCGQASAQQVEDNDKWGFWSRQRKGANYFNTVPTRAWMEAASALGVEFVRLAPDKWESAGRDFLIGDADRYDSLNERDLSKLLSVLDDASANHINVVLTMLSLPGNRWRQNNDDRDDPRLWKDARHHEQAFRFWRDLAGRIKNHPAVVGYDPLNEPHPGRALLGDIDPAGEEYSRWVAKSRGTPADLNLFNRGMVAAIRSVDAETPIIIEADAFDSPAGFRFLEPVNDDRVLYSFHFYEPWNYTAKRANKGRFSYPDRMPAGDSGATKRWTSNDLSGRIQPVSDWILRHKIPPERIVASEFGCSREAGGVAQYLGDLITIFNERKWHWSFYAFREDTWAGMDYEVGSGKLPWKYWQDIDSGKSVEPPRRDNPIFDVLKREFGSGKRP
jgi:endoglucanase